MRCHPIPIDRGEHGATLGQVGAASSSVASSSVASSSVIAKSSPAIRPGMARLSVSAVAEVRAAGSEVTHAMAHTKPASSRAIAVTTTARNRPLAIICR